jgi:hypothetical protein
MIENCRQVNTNALVGYKGIYIDYMTKEIDQKYLCALKDE